MRVSAGLRAPRAVYPVWLLVVVIGTGIMLVLILFTPLIPWGNMGHAVQGGDLPQVPRGWLKPRWGAAVERRSAGNWIELDAEGRIWSLEGHPAKLSLLALGSVEAHLRRSLVASPGLPPLLRVHRKARWRDLRALLGAAARASCGSVDLRVLPWRLLRVDLVPPGAPGERVLVDGLPLADPARTRGEVRKRFLGRSPPVVRVAVADDVEVQAVVAALACYAGSNGTVHLARPE